MAAGLQTSIWNNNIKSMLLLAAYPFILGGVLFGAVAAYGYYSYGVMGYYNGYRSATWPAAFDYSLLITARYWPMIVTIVLVWFIIAYFLQGSIIRAMAKSHSVSRREEPELYNLLENLCVAQGMKMPRLEIIETHARNAFASGISESTYCVTVTRGLMQSLSRDELEAVLAHELCHIQNRDVRLMMVCVVFTGMLGVAAQLIWSGMRFSLYSGNSRSRGNNLGILMQFIGLIVGIGYIATILARFAISRRREFMADAGAVQMTHNPDAMMRALMRLDGRVADIPNAPEDIRAMCFENRHAFLGLFATHPPIQARVKAIADYSNIPVPGIKAPLRADDADVFNRPAADTVRSNWTTRQRFAHRRDKNPWQ